MIDESVREEVMRLREKGVSIATIARQFAISRGSVYGILNGNGSGNDQPRERGRHHPFRERTVIPVAKPSQRVVNQREDVEIIQLEVEKQKAARELEKVIPQREHPLVIERKAKFETKKLDLDEFKVDRELQALKQEEIKKTEIEKQAHLEKIAEAERVERENVRRERWEKWIQELQDWSLLRGISLPWGFSLSTKVKFEVRDAIKKALETRSESENGDEIRKLIREIAQVTIQPYIDRFEEDKRIEKTKQEAAELERKEKEAAENKVRVERIKKERERVEAEEKAFWDTVRERRKKEEIEELLQVGMNRLNHYLLANRKELGTVDFKDREEARRHLERGLKEEIEGTETDEEVEKIADEILSGFFFEE